VFTEINDFTRTSKLARDTNIKKLSSDLPKQFSVMTKNVGRMLE